MEATMDTTVSELAKWLESVFPGGKVQYDWVGDDAYLLYRVHRADGKRSEIQFSETALEDYTTVEILRDLTAESVGAQLKTRTSHRFTYGPSREVTPVERMIVVCDGRSYRVVRNLERAVSVFDEDGHELRNLPPFLVLPGSIFHTPTWQWQQDIPKWL